MQRGSGSAMQQLVVRHCEQLAGCSHLELCKVNGNSFDMQTLGIQAADAAIDLRLP